MAVLANLARMTTATTGTGTLTVDAAATGYISFLDANVPDGATVSYAIEDGNNREAGRGVFASAGTLTRAVVLGSTNAGLKINLSGTAEVFITALAEDFDQVFKSATVSSAVAAVDFVLGGNVDEWELHFQNVMPSTDGAALWLRTSTDGGANFATSGYSSGVFQKASSSGVGAVSTSASAILLTDNGATTGVGNAANEMGVSGVMRLFRPGASQYFNCAGEGSLVQGNGNIAFWGSAGQLAAAADVDAIRILFSTGNIASGNFQLRKVAK